MKLTKEVQDFFSKDLNKSLFCVEAKMTRSTLLRRLEKPDGFRAKEIEDVKRVLGVKEIFEKEKTKK